jgi:hypothetical protein
VGPRAGLDAVEKEKLLAPPGLELRPLGRPTRSQELYRLRSFIIFSNLWNFRKLLNLSNFRKLSYYLKLLPNLACFLYASRFSKFLKYLILDIRNFR